MDEADVAGDNIERDLAIAQRVVALRKPEAEFSGTCHHCNEPVETPKRWCDAECRNHWEEARRIFRRQ